MLGVKGYSFPAVSKLRRRLNADSEQITAAFIQGKVVPGLMVLDQLSNSIDQHLC